MFALGIVALVLVTVVNLQIARLNFFSTGGLSPSMEICINAWSAMQCLMVCSHDTFMSPAWLN